VQAGTVPPLGKASGAVAAATLAGADLFGWQAINWRNKLLFNVPNADGSFHQHVLNTASGAWSRYTEIEALCFGLYSDDLYFGTADGVVYKIDGDTDDGASIFADAQQAWTALGGAASGKIVAIKPVVESLGPVDYAFGIGYDFAEVPTVEAESNAPSSAPWDTSPWDTTPWGPDRVIDSTWRVAGGGKPGQMISTRFRVSAQQPISWLRTDFRLKGSAGL
jgi:hypothetical protein